MQKKTVDIEPGFEELFDVLYDAYLQAASGKGKERHGQGRNFLDQPMFRILADHGLGFATGQSTKKLAESLVLLKEKGDEAAIREILGAIVYAASAVLFIQHSDGDSQPDDRPVYTPEDVTFSVPDDASLRHGFSISSEN